MQKAEDRQAEAVKLFRLTLPSKFCLVLGFLLQSE